MKLWDILTTANTNLRRNKVRTILTVVAIFIGAFTISLTLAVRAGVNDYIDRQVGSVGGDNLLIVQAKQGDGMQTGPQKYDPDANKNSTATGFSFTTLSQSDIDKIASVEGVDSVTPNLPTQFTYIQYGNGDQYEINAGQALDGLNIDLNQGSPVNNQSSEYQIDLPIEFIEPLGFANATDAVGKTVKMAATSPAGQQSVVDVKVVGVQNQSVIQAGQANINDALARYAYDVSTEGLPDNMRNQYYAAAVMMDPKLDDTQRTEVKQKMQDMGYDAMTIEDQIGLITNIIDAITISLTGFGAIALLAASFGIINTLFMAVQERTKEIGLMKAMGMRSGKVFALFSFEAILLGFWGSVIGIAAAFLAGQGINAVATSTFLKDLTGFNLTEFPIINIVAIILIIMLIAFLAGTLPARRAAKQNPIDALRYE